MRNVSYIRKKNVFHNEMFLEVVDRWMKSKLLLFALEVFSFIYQNFRDDKEFYFGVPSSFVVNFDPLPLLNFELSELEEKLRENKREKKNEKFKEALGWLMDLFSNGVYGKLEGEEVLKLAFLLYLLENDIRYSVELLYVDFLEEVSRIREREFEGVQEKVGSYLLEKFEHYLIFNNISSSVIQNFYAFLRLLSDIFQLEKETKINKSLVVSLTEGKEVNGKVLEKLVELVKLSRELFVLGKGFFEFSFSPPLSAGHWHLLEVFSLTIPQNFRGT